MAEQQVNENQVRAVLQPIAAPYILGLHAFAGSTFIVSVQENCPLPEFILV